MWVEILNNGGLADMLYMGVKLGIYPPLIFLGIGTMTDFAPLISNPKSLLLGAAAQFGIFGTYMGARLLTATGLVDFTQKQSAAIAIIGGADGPTAIFVTSRLAPELLGSIAVAAYSYMALVPVIQPPIMKALTSKKERSVVMKQLRTVSKTERSIFPIMVTIVVSLIVPDAAVLVGMLMLGNLMKECGVVDLSLIHISGNLFYAGTAADKAITQRPQQNVEHLSLIHISAALDELVAAGNQYDLVIMISGPMVMTRSYWLPAEIGRAHV